MAVYGNETLDFIKDGKLFEQLCSYRLPKKALVPQSMESFLQKSLHQNVPTESEKLYFQVIVVSP